MPMMPLFIFHMFMHDTDFSHARLHGGGSFTRTNTAIRATIGLAAHNASSAPSI